MNPKNRYASVDTEFEAQLNGASGLTFSQGEDRKTTLVGGHGGITDNPSEYLLQQYGDLYLDSILSWIRVKKCCYVGVASKVDTGKSNLTPLPTGSTVDTPLDTENLFTRRTNGKN